MDAIAEEPVDNRPRGLKTSSAPVIIEPHTITSQPVETLKKSPVAEKKKRAPRKKKDPNAPASVVSSYTLFFRDKQAAIKEQNPKAKASKISFYIQCMNILYNFLIVRFSLVIFLKLCLNFGKPWASLKVSNYIFTLLSVNCLHTCVRMYGHSFEMKNHVKSFVSEAVYKKRNAEDKIRYQREMAAYKAGLDQSNKEEEIEDEATNEVFRQDESTTDVSSHATKLAQPEEKTDNDCIRSGCHNVAIKSSEWDDEYCCNDCAVSHCKGQ